MPFITPALRIRRWLGSHDGSPRAAGSCGRHWRRGLLLRGGATLVRFSKAAARALVPSPSTMRTHVENMFRKLERSTHAAVTRKALSLERL
jgi:hypothetical protein